LPKPGKLKKVQHFKAIPWKEAGGFYKRLHESDSMGALALQFTLLTAARSGEVRGATWDEIDLKARTWTIAAERMKAQREHVIPLCQDAVDLLERMPRLEGAPYVFAGARGGMLTDVAVNKAIRRLSPDATVLGLRSTFRDWCAESTNYPNEVAEMALAHTIGNAVERAYRRGDLFAKRANLMRDWCAYLNKPAPAEVTPIQQGRRA
jgi:integrase